MVVRITFCVVLYFSFLTGFGQQGSPCGSDELLQKILREDPTALDRLEQNWRDIDDYRFAQQSQRAEFDGNTIITIPVVFHIVHPANQAPGVGKNISDAQIMSQLDVLNECYRMRNADRALVPDSFKARIADVRIEFCLASFDPNGQPTTGIDRSYIWDGNPGDFDDEAKVGSYWDPSKYLNIWTTELVAPLLGYATFPNMGPKNQDGVVVDYRYVGKHPANPYGNSRLGKTAVHEVGHWLGLYHVFQDSCAGMTPSDCGTAGDRICDTPPAASASYGSPNLLQNTCHETPIDYNDMWMNFMDYVDDINLNMFTYGQRDAMRAVLNTNRLSIQSSKGCTDTTKIFTYTGKVVDESTQQGVPSAKVLFDGPVDFEVTTDANGNFSVPALIEDYYNVYAGKWGYREIFFANHERYTSSSAGITIPLRNHYYYDDFLFDFGWTKTQQGASKGFWVRDVAVGTFSGADAANPSFDVGDDYGLKCYLTGNGSSTANVDDLDNGKVTLVSPAFDVSGYTEPYLRYFRWFFDGFETAAVPDDNMIIKLNNGSSQVTLEDLTANANSWTQRTFKISDYITPTASMRLIIEVNDLSSGNPNIVEGALDKFEVLEATAVGLNEVQSDITSVIVFPNPGRGLLNVSFQNTDNNPVEVKILNALGQQLDTKPANGEGPQRVQFNVENQAPGLYFVQVKSAHFEKNVKFSLTR